MNTIKEIIDDLKEGKMVIIVDDEDRENEGDLVQQIKLIQILLTLWQSMEEA